MSEFSMSIEEWKAFMLDPKIVAENEKDYRLMPGDIFNTLGYGLLYHVSDDEAQTNDEDTGQSPKAEALAAVLRKGMSYVDLETVIRELDEVYADEQILELFRLALIVLAQSSPAEPGE